MVTHPFHPLRGQQLEVLSRGRWAAVRVYVCDGGPLGRVALPEDVTDRRGGEPGERPLTLEVLAELAVVVAAVGGERGTAR